MDGSLYQRVASSSTTTRTNFIRKTYLNLGLALAYFVGITALMIVSGFAELFATTVLTSTIGVLVFFALFIGASYLANSWASNNYSRGLQYLGLFGYATIEALIMAPLVLFAASFVGIEIVGLAAFLTLFLFGALTFIVFYNKADFSFLGGFLSLFGFIALGLIIAALIFGFSLGLWFSGAMVLFAGGAILYDTSNVLHHYREDQYVAASLALFASVALLFYYILRFLMQFTRD